jgi:prepilin-type N-terminal cleavage/methylation domain-containing protein
VYRDLSKSHPSDARVQARADRAPRVRAGAAFTLVEVMISVVVISILCIGIYGAVANSISIIKVCRENERATQILSDKMDMIRLYNWQQLTNRFLPTNFTERLEALNTNSTMYYTGAISIVRAPITESYSPNLMQVTVDVKWSSGKRPQTRSMTTYVARYGLQTYIIN